MATVDSTNETPTYLHLSRPLAPNATNLPTTSSSTTPTKIHIQPSALLSILDHSLRRSPDQDRVIGTLLGTRSDDGGSLINIENTYPVPHTESDEQVEVDMEFQKTMLQLHLRANPKEILVGWYASSSELNTFSALIQNFYSQQGEGTWPFPAVHLTVSTDVSATQGPEIRAYISSPIGVTPERAADSCSFIPVPHEVKYGEAERSGLEMVASARNEESGRAGAIMDIEGLERGVEYVLEMLERVGNYVGEVLDEEREGSTPLGQFLLNALSLAPKVGTEDVERDFNNHIQDVLAISYLTNTIRTQIDLSNRLATAALTTAGAPPVAGATGTENAGAGAGATNGEGKGEGKSERGGRGGRGGRGRGGGGGGGGSEA